MMVVKPVRIPNAQIEALQSFAKREGTTVSMLVREGVARVVSDRIQKERANA